MILSWYCPMCFKTRIGEGSAERVRLDSPRIDKDQFRHSRKGNRIPVLDLDCPGDICQHHEACAVNCLVCGHAVFEGESPEYRLFRKVLEQGDTEAPKAPKTLRAFDQIRTREKVRAALASEQAVLVGSWAMPVHRRCAQGLPCGCMMPLGAESCPCKKASFSAGGDEPDEPVPAPAAPRRAPQVQPAPRERSRGAEGTMGRAIAGWGAAKGAVLTVSIDVVREPPETDCMLLPKRPRPAPKPAPKPVPEGVRRLDGWVQPRDAPAPAGLPRPAGPFSVREHLRAFDVDRHGYALTKDGLCYRFPDGRFVRVSAGVNTLDDDGLLTPSANNEPQTRAVSGSS